jgi:hypothetical protein
MRPLREARTSRGGKKELQSTMTPDGVFSTGLLTSYCEPADVLALLVGYDLTRLGNATVVAARVAQLLPITTQMLDNVVGHDFFWHADDTVLLDGDWRSRLSLYETGRAPLLTVHALVVNGRTLPPESYVVYPQRAEIQLRPGAGAGSGWCSEGRFPKGSKTSA